VSVIVLCRNSPPETVAPNTAAVSIAKPVLATMFRSPVAVASDGTIELVPAWAESTMVTSAVGPAAIAPNRRSSGWW
jgi:hypothetical protein